MLEARFDFLLFQAKDLRFTGYYDERGSVLCFLRLVNNPQDPSNSVARSPSIAKSVSILTMQTMNYTNLERGFCQS